MQKTKSLKTFAERRDLWMRNLLLHDMPSGAKMVGVRLALYMHEDQQFAFPSYDRLGKDCGLSARQVQTHVRRLELGTSNDHAHWITVKHVRNTGNAYWLRYWWEE
jgi:hypothetical protein